MKVVLALVALLCPVLAAAGETSLLLGGVSHHFANDDVKRNERNWLIGVEYRFNPDWALSASRYKNSEYAYSNAFAVQYTPGHYDKLHWGLLVGAVDGYQKFTGIERVPHYVKAPPECNCTVEAYDHVPSYTRKSYKPLAGITIEWRERRFGVQLTLVPGTPETEPVALLGFKLPL